MRLQLLSDLHLESESFIPRPAPGAALLVLGGDIDSRWRGLQRFAGWPVPVVMVAGNHEFDGRDIDAGLAALRVYTRSLGIHLLESECSLLVDDLGRTIRLVGTTRWSDFDVFGPGGQARALRAAGYFLRVMRATRHGAAFDAQAVRQEALRSREWLVRTLRQADPAQPAEWDKTVVITHFAPSLRSADRRYGTNPGTASFCNADDDLLAHADLWLHGHLHCRHDYTVARPNAAPTRVVCAARGLAHKGESDCYDAGQVITL